ncbi:hypothetical protein KPH14_009790 [Odynerus spinipes]|uniref:Uncharacterized protein n=1 Tax=Odynerus spinipes TaxID=1348599 RepID=A0AAD9RVU2_9HYME|nr:hypothetical protein KPH14_009790 [Odynerus spinipes]
MDLRTVLDIDGYGNPCGGKYSPRGTRPPKMLIVGTKRCSPSLLTHCSCGKSDFWSITQHDLRGMILLILNIFSRHNLELIFGDECRVNFIPHRHLPYSSLISQALLGYHTLLKLKSKYYWSEHPSTPLRTKLVGFLSTWIANPYDPLKMRVVAS